MDGGGILVKGKSTAEVLPATRQRIRINCQVGPRDIGMRPAGTTSQEAQQQFWIVEVIVGMNELAFSYGLRFSVSQYDCPEILNLPELNRAYNFNKTGNCQLDSSGRPLIIRINRNLTGSRTKS